MPREREWNGAAGGARPLGVKIRTSVLPENICHNETLSVIAVLATAAGERPLTDGSDFVEKVRGCRGAGVLIQSGAGTGVLPMMGERRSGQEALFYEFSLERHVPAEHLLRSIDRFVDLDGVRCELAPFYSEVGRPSIDPELMIRMLIVGYCFGIRSERRLCDEVHLNLATAGFFRRAWIVNSVLRGLRLGRRSEGFRLLCVLDATASADRMG